ncbi:RNB domain-containing ribonuclease [Allobranchiibius huperziae]|uniref:Exoribonuclease R n=1 Tax=Allobranchiibius huperziae TaxID=1874116 RepID=A0A853DEH4_9MICO|nr:RNB domain-containing ribonuclease [Allobranchiibius huperziae]NYJ74369.1 exoribonuclease R [Allobranchiibius huperziae]
MLPRVVRAPQADPTSADPGPLEQAFTAIRAEHKLSPDYPQPALAEAEKAATATTLPERDETAVPFFTIDPPGSTDLDQAMYLERTDDGYRVRYAIADVAAYVVPGGALDQETRARGETVYLPDMRVPLHPTVLSEDAASLLPDQVRGAYVWDIELDASGDVRAAQVYLARVRSIARLDYDGVQQQIGADAPDGLRLLKEIGELRIALQRKRGGADLPMPEQEVQQDEDGTYRLQFRPPVPSEDWNAQISLLAGMCAATMMLEAKVGILRTMPAPPQDAIDTFRRRAEALGITWPRGQAYGEFIAGLDRTDPKHLALIHDATSLFRGAGYTPFDGQVPAETEQAAVAAPYAHVTAPLRRLVDRFGLAICEAVSSGQAPPDWARQALPTLPDIMRSRDQVASAVGHACDDAVEAAVLSARVGETFEAVVVARNDKAIQVQLRDIAVLASCPGDAAPGDVVRVVLVATDVGAHTVTFRLG